MQLEKKNWKYLFPVWILYRQNWSIHLSVFNTTLTKQLDVDLLQRVNAAELIQFMVNLVENEGFIIICSVVPDYVHHCNKNSSYSSYSGAGLLNKPDNKKQLLQRCLPADGTSMLTTSILSK